MSVPAASATVLLVLCLTMAILGPGAVVSGITFQSSNTAACSGATQALVLTTADLSNSIGTSSEANNNGNLIFFSCGGLLLSCEAGRRVGG